MSRRGPGDVGSWLLCSRQVPTEALPRQGLRAGMETAIPASEGTIKRTVRNVSLCGCKLLAVIPKIDVVPTRQSDRCGERQGWMEPGENSWSGGRGDLCGILITPEERRGLLRMWRYFI